MSGRVDEQGSYSLRQQFASVTALDEWPIEVPHVASVEAVIFFGPAVLDRRSCPALRGMDLCPDYWSRGPLARTACSEGTIYMMPKWGDSWPLSPDDSTEPYMTIGVDDG